VADTNLWAGDPGTGWRRYIVADVFTGTPLEGNPLAVFPDGRGLAADTMQRVARELNLSETVFFLPPEDTGDVRLRIFTPANELPFAGHPVLGSAFVLGERLGTEALTLETGAGPIPVDLERDAGGQITFGRMEQNVPAVRAGRGLRCPGGAGAGRRVGGRRRPRRIPPRLALAPPREP